MERYGLGRHQTAFCILLYHEIIIKNNLKLFLIVKAKYYVIEPYYLEGTTPDLSCSFSKPHILFRDLSASKIIIFRS